MNWGGGWYYHWNLIRLHFHWRRILDTLVVQRTDSASSGCWARGKLQGSQRDKQSAADAVVFGLTVGLSFGVREEKGKRPVGLQRVLHRQLLLQWHRKTICCETLPVLQFGTNWPLFQLELLLISGSEMWRMGLTTAIGLMRLWWCLLRQGVFLLGPPCNWTLVPQSVAFLKM